MAKETFERLGAVLDAERTMELLRDEAATRTFVFTDMVGSTGSSWSSATRSGTNG